MTYDRSRFLGGLGVRVQQDDEEAPPASAIPGMATWWALGDASGLQPQTGLPDDATGWDALDPSTRALAVIADWEPTVTETNKPSFGDRVVATPGVSGLVYDMSAGETTAVGGWTTSSGFVAFRYNDVQPGEVLLMCFNNHFSNRYYGLSVTGDDHPAIVIRDNTSWSRLYHAATTLVPGTWYTLGFRKAAVDPPDEDGVPQLFLDGSELTGLTQDLATYAATAWLNTVTQKPSAFSIAGRLTNEATRELNYAADVSIESYGWTPDVLSPANMATIASEKTHEA